MYNKSSKEFDLLVTFMLPRRPSLQDTTLHLEITPDTPTPTLFHEFDFSNNTKNLKKAHT
jgi:hypothetical protein